MYSILYCYRIVSPPFLLASLPFFSSLPHYRIGNFNGFVFFYGSFQAVLAAIVVVALKGLFLQFKRLWELWKICKYDAVSRTVRAMTVVACPREAYGVVLPRVALFFFTVRLDKRVVRCGYSWY